MQMMLNPLSLFLSLLPDLSLCECVPTLILSFWTLVSFYPYADGLFSRYFLWNLLQCLTLSRYTLPLENGSRFEWGKSPYSAERKAWPQRAVGLYCFCYVISGLCIKSLGTRAQTLWCAYPWARTYDHDNMNLEGRHHFQRKGCCIWRGGNGILKIHAQLLPTVSLLRRAHKQELSLPKCMVEDCSFYTMVLFKIQFHEDGFSLYPQ